MTVRVAISLVFALAGRVLLAQDPQITHFHEVKASYNPAAVGQYQGVDMIALYRTQWVGITGHPVTQIISADVPVYPWSSGFGLVITSNIAGAERVSTLHLAFAYHKKIGSGTIVSLGLAGGGLQQSLDGTKLRAPEGDYSAGDINHNDKKIPSTKVSDIVADFGMGLKVTASRWWAGLGATHLLEPATTLQVVNLGTTEISFSRTFFLQAGTVFQINPDWAIAPAIQAKSDLVVHQAELQGRMIFRDNMWAGLAFRGFSSSTVDALIGMVGMQVTSGLRAGYSYDLGLSTLNRVHSGSHEFFLNYRIPIEPPSKGKIINNPRFISI